MEKIIAVVVMIAIVIGLIATAVMPTVQQMNEQGDQANQQLAGLTQTMDGSVLSGKSVKAEISSNLTKFAATTDKLMSITLVVEKADGSATETLTATDKATATTNLARISDAANFTRTTTTWASGKVKTYTYTVIQ